MISHDRYLAILAESDAAVRAAAEAAFVKLLEKIRAGQTPRSAIDAILKEFNAGAMEGFREALNAILESSLGPKEIRAYKVGNVKLSDALYHNAQVVSASTQQIINKHMQGLHDARELRKALYEGYNLQDDPLKVVKPLPKYLQVEFDRFKAAALKTPALRAAYLEAIRQKEAGAGMDAIEQALKVAFYERNRYYANRIARTELHRNYTDRVAKEIMEDEQIEYVQWRMSSKHPKTDICDRHAKLDAYGLGPGVYPKAEAPKPPAHPHCLCTVTPKLLIDSKKPPRFNPKAERAFLAQLPAQEAARIAGSYEKRRRVLEDGDTLEAIYNEGKDPLYYFKRIGKLLDTGTQFPYIRAMPAARGGEAKTRGTKMSFQEWYNEADMPTVVDGQWVDLETGIPFSAWTAVVKKARKPFVLEINGKAATVAEGLAYVARLALNQSKAMERAKIQKADSTNLSAYLVAANAAVAAARALSAKSKKAEIAAAIKLNQAASRILNTL